MSSLRPFTYHSCPVILLRLLPQALAIKAHPLHVADSLQTLAFMLDDIWYYAGDRSTDVRNVMRVCAGFD